MADLGRVSSVFELEVYKRSYLISLEIHKFSLDFPKIEQYGGLADQMRRSSKSVCANLAEGWGKQTTENERKQFVRTALGSATETQVWLHYARDLNYCDGEQIDMWVSEYNQIKSMLGTMFWGQPKSVKVD